MKERVGFMVYRDWREVLNDFDDKLYRELMEAIFDLGFDNKETPQSPLVSVAMKLIKPQILRDWAKAEERSNTLKANGLKGGRPKKQKDLEKPNGLEKNQKNQMVSEKPNAFEKTKCNQYIKYKKQEIKNETQEDNNIESIDSYSDEAAEEDKINYMEIIDFYNNSTKGCNITSCVKLTEKRKMAIRARLKEYGKEKVFEAITKAVASSFLNGHNDRNWKADIDFIFNADKMTRILEGKYDNSYNTQNNNVNNGGSRAVGEKVLGDIFAEIEERRRAESVTD